MPHWIVPFDKLGDEQKELVDFLASTDKNVWISGFAGSGKSVVLADTAKYLTNRNPSLKIAILLYTQSLVNMFSSGLGDIDCNNVEVQTIYSFMSGSQTYDYIMCDEVQDFTQDMVDAVKDRCRKCLIMAGDKFQSIYEKDARFGKPTINPESLLFSISASSKSLNRIYRLTPTIIKAVDKFVPEMSIMTADKAPQKQDALITICKADSRSQEATWTYSRAEKEVRNGYRTAILFNACDSCVQFTNDILLANGKCEWAKQNNYYGRPDFGKLNDHLRANGIKLMYLGNGYGNLSLAESNGYAVMTTYHSAKGLDFDNVYLPFSDSNTFRVSTEKNRAVFMVAMTRAGRNLTISYTGFPNPFVKRFDTDGLCNDITARDTMTSAAQSHNYSNDFDF